MAQNMFYELPTNAKALVFQFDRTKVEAFGNVQKEILEYHDDIVNKYISNIQYIKYFYENTIKIKEAALQMNANFDDAVKAINLLVFNTVKLEKKINPEKFAFTSILQFSSEKKCVFVNYVNNVGVTLLFVVYI